MYLKLLCTPKYALNAHIWSPHLKVAPYMLQTCHIGIHAYVYPYTDVFTI